MELYKDAGNPTGKLARKAVRGNVNAYIELCIADRQKDSAILSIVGRILVS